MSQADFSAATPYATFGRTAAEAPADARLAFIRRTYTHLAAAVYALVALEFLFFQTLPLDVWVPNVLFASRWGWLIMFGAFIGVSVIADRWARSDTSVGMQYAGLFLYVLAESVILAPLLWIANQYSIEIAGVASNPIAVAAVATLLIFGALTASVLITRHDFSYLGPALSMAGMVLFGVVLLGVFGLLNFGVLICSAFVVFACGYILFYTSNVLHHYRTDQHVAASLALFAAVALLFWYVLQIVLAFSGRD